MNWPINVQGGTCGVSRARTVIAAAVNASPSRVGSDPQGGQDLAVDPGDPPDALPAQPLDVVRVADRANPAAHGGSRAPDPGRDPPVPGSAGAAAPITAVESARRGRTAPSSSTYVAPHDSHRARRGRRRSVVAPWSRTSRARAWPHRRSRPPHSGQASSPAARSASAPLKVHDPDHRVVVPAQRTSVVYHGPGRQGSTGVGPTPKPGVSTVEESAVLPRRHRGEVQTRASRANPPARHGGGADESAGHVPVVVTVDGANPTPGRHPRWRSTAVMAPRPDYHRL